jgi:hypothetical protein
MRMGSCRKMETVLKSSRADIFTREDSSQGRRMEKEK